MPLVTTESEEQANLARPDGARTELGMVGLGRMGANLVRRVSGAGHRCVVFDVDPDKVNALLAEGATGRLLPRRSGGQPVGAESGVGDGPRRGDHR